MRLEISGTQIHILDSQTGGAQQKPSLFLVHGAGGDASVWEASARHFRQRRSVYRMELPAHGGSAGSGEEEIGAYSRWVRSTLDALAETSVVLVGHSMGGAIALDLALSPPLKVRGMVLVGTGAKLGVLPEIFDMLERDQEAFFALVDRAAFAESTPRNLRRRLIQPMKRCPASVILGDFRACDRFDMRHRLEEICLPTLILCGEEDRLTPVKYSEYLRSRIEDSRLVLLPKAGHMVMAESPQPFNQALEAFLDALGR